MHFWYDPKMLQSGMHGENYPTKNKRIDLLRTGCSASEYCREALSYTAKKEDFLSEMEREKDKIDGLILRVEVYDNNLENIPDSCKALKLEAQDKPDAEFEGPIRIYLSEYYRYHVLNKSAQSLFFPHIIWFSGAENIEKITTAQTQFFKNCTDVNMYCMFFLMQSYSLKLILPAIILLWEVWIRNYIITILDILLIEREMRLLWNVILKI